MGKSRLADVVVELTLEGDVEQCRLTAVVVFVKIKLHGLDARAVGKSVFQDVGIVEGQIFNHDLRRAVGVELTAHGVKRTPSFGFCGQEMVQVVVNNGELRREYRCNDCRCKQ